MGIKRPAMARQSLLVCVAFAIAIFAVADVKAEGAEDAVQELKVHRAKVGEALTPEEVKQEQAEIDAAKKEAEKRAAEPADSLDEIVATDKVHESTKQSLVEEEKLYSLMSFNFRKGATGQYSYADYYVRHMNRNVMISTINGPMDRQDATFKVIHALCEPGSDKCPAANAGSTGCISFESVNYPGFFLTATEKGAMSLGKADGSDAFAFTASFCIQAGLADANAVSLELLGKAGKFVRHSGYSMFSCSSDDEGECSASSRKDEFNADSTFFLKPGKLMGRCAGPDKPNECICYPGFLGDQCTLKCPGRERKGNTLTVCNGQGDCVLGEDGTATCKCMPGFLGRKCNLLCPRDKNENLCSGHGGCAVDDKFDPVCECHKGFLGDICQYECPGREKGSGDFCSGKGSCYIREEDLAEKRPKRAECTCEAGFKGFTCDQECPKDAEGTICGGHGTCDLKYGKAVCVCTYGFRGKDCTKSCPRNERGQVCSTKGSCAMDKDGNAVCRCKSGYGGSDCSISCPGIDATGKPCNGNGSCDIDVEKKVGKCSCHKTHMGETCSHRCPMDPHSDLACGGADRGTCVRDDEEVPNGTRCECKEPFAGKTCHITCPMFQGQICGGNGECFIKTTGKVSVGICKCDVGFVGPNCQGKCPRGNKKGVEDGEMVNDDNGEICSGHGTCGFTKDQRADCTCDEGWVSHNCEHRVCRTERGVFNKETEECTCPAGEVCCERETVRLAQEMKKMLAKEAKHRQSKTQDESTFKKK